MTALMIETGQDVIIRWNLRMCVCVRVRTNKGYNGKINSKMKIFHMRCRNNQIVFQVEYQSLCYAL